MNFEIHAGNERFSMNTLSVRYNLEIYYIVIYILYILYLLVFTYQLSLEVWNYSDDIFYILFQRGFKWKAYAWRQSYYAFTVEIKRYTCLKSFPKKRQCHWKVDYAIVIFVKSINRQLNKLISRETTQRTTYKWKFHTNGS